MRVGVIALIAVLALGCAAGTTPSTTASPTDLRAQASSPVPVASITLPALRTPTPAQPTSRPSLEGPSTTPAPTRTEDARRPRPDGFIYVVTDGLRVRSKPEVSTSSKRYEPLLWRGALAWVVDGPVRGSGYDWYLIIPMGEADLQVHPDPPPGGWVAAASKSGEPWIADWGVSCRTPFDAVSDFDYPPQGAVGLSCFGGRTLRFAAMATRWDIPCLGVGDARVEPAWLRSCGSRYVLDPVGGFPPFERAPLYISVAPEAEIDISPSTATGRWTRVQVTGHYDDPRARTCSGPVEAGAVKHDALDQPVRGCRTRLVVTRLVS